MSTIALPVRIETPALYEHVGVIEPMLRWGLPIWPGDPPTDGLDLPDVVQPNWMMLAVAFGRKT